MESGYFIHKEGNRRRWELRKTQLPGGSVFRAKVGKKIVYSLASLLGESHIFGKLKPLSSHPRPMAGKLSSNHLQIISKERATVIARVVNSTGINGNVIWCIKTLLSELGPPNSVDKLI